MLEKQVPLQKWARTLVSICVLVLMSAFMLTACTTGKIAASPPKPTPTVTLTPSASPPVLPRHTGHEILYLTNKFTSIANTGGDFYASHPYIIFILCTGTGKITVTYSPQGQVTFDCSRPPQVRAAAAGNNQHPPSAENIHVQVATSDGNAIWEVSIQFQV